MTAVRRGPRSLALLLAALAWGCSDPGDGDVLTLGALGEVQAILVLDLNGSGGPDQADLPLGGWRLNLEQPAGGVVASTTTESDGTALFEGVPVGLLVPNVPASELGDTLGLLPASTQPFVLAHQQIVQLTAVVTAPFYSVPEVRDLPPGIPLFTTGVALNAVGAGDRVLHLRAGSEYLRVLSVEDGVAAPGDSVRVAGRTTSDLGVPVLDGRAVYRLAAVGAPVPVGLSTGEAAGARGGALDAALVRILQADVESVLDQGDGVVTVVANDGTGPVRIRFRSFLQVDPDAIDPDTDIVLAATGLLVPANVNGSLVWELLPRTLSDVVIGRVSD